MLAWSYDVSKLLGVASNTVRIKEGGIMGRQKNSKQIQDFISPQEASSKAEELKGVTEARPLVKRGDEDVRSRVTEAQKTFRLQQVVNWLLDGIPKLEVTNKIREKWGLCIRQSKRYLAEASDQIEALSAAEIRGATTLALFRLTELYHQALKGGDLKTALDIVKVQNRMLGLNAPDKVETKSVENWDTMSVAEQLDHVAGILSRADTRERSTN
jgi:hypothetical protein